MFLSVSCTPCIKCQCPTNSDVKLTLALKFRHCILYTLCIPTVLQESLLQCYNFILLVSGELLWLCLLLNWGGPPPVLVWISLHARLLSLTTTISIVHVQNAPYPRRIATSQCYRMRTKSMNRTFRSLYALAPEPTVHSLTKLHSLVLVGSSPAESAAGNCRKERKIKKVMQCLKTSTRNDVGML